MVDPGDLFKKTNILRSAGYVMDNLKNVFVSRSNSNIKPQANYKEHPASKILSKFLVDLNTELLNYKENTLKQLADILQKEVNDYYRKAPYNPILFSDKVKKFVNKQLKELSETEPAELKIKTRRFANNPHAITFFESIDKLNKFFNEKDTKLLDDLIKNLHDNAETGDTEKIGETIKDAFKVLVVERYNSMKEEERDKFHDEINNIVDKTSEVDDSVLDTLKRVIDETFRGYIEGIFSKNDEVDEKKTNQKMSEVKESKENNEVITKTNDVIQDNGADDEKSKSTKYLEFYK
ncbi:unnamed protein product [Diatraea saccharalis]|uniref:Uncharacterized protein n=1 Tax=Diatraea saccharalis TaxID=40085 RepID=A0A9N9WH09_9NEOP|nr:unnamed protein product [Diatraea saccharalis]